MDAANCAAVLLSVPINYHFHGCTVLLVALVVVSGAILNTHLVTFTFTNYTVLTETLLSHAFLAGEASYCNYSMVFQEGFSTIAPAKMNVSEPNLAGRNYVTKGTHRKIWASIACVAPPGGEAATFLSAHIASPLDPLRTEKTADFGVESRDPTANLCPS